jgi:hypothetical protein
MYLLLKHLKENNVEFNYFDDSKGEADYVMFYLLKSYCGFSNYVYRNKYGGKIVGTTISFDYATCKNFYDLGHELNINSFEFLH